MYSAQATKLARRPDYAGGSPVKLNSRERAQYSISRAILAAEAVCRGKTRQAQSFEFDLSQDIERSMPKGIPPHGGLWIPTSIPLTRAGLDTKTSTKGAELVFTRPGTLIEALYNRTLVIQLGTRMLIDLQGYGSVGLPKLKASATAVWVAENTGSDIAESAATTDLVPLTPKTLMASTSFTRELLAQSTPSVDQVVADDLARINAVAIDRAAIHGAGGIEPTGIYNLAVNSVAMAGAITFPKVVALETAIGVAKGETSELAYLTSPEIREKAKVTAELTGSPLRLWRDGQMNDCRAEATNQIAKNLGAGTDEHGIVLGAWPELIIGEWGAMELIADPFTNKKKGVIETTSFLCAGIAVRHLESFAKGTGLTLT